MSTVTATIQSKAIPTYPLGLPEKNPMFFEKRVYQGSSGKVYPVPFIDKVFDEPESRTYRVASLENEYIYLEMLPEIGGRIFKGQDKTNANYDFFYRQDVIKPALVGLAGPWISGGVEFNWPQHHRPGTFMPSAVFIEEEDGGARTVWMSELDPLTRMKGMHGVRLRPDSALVELRVRLYNRTPITQTFLWWANVAARVHDRYQSFFPPDVHYVADHAVRAMSSFPIAQNDYYGVDYAARSGANDLSWYKNIPVPTSYMVCETQGGFFGGYDFDKRGGFVHVANKHISPGKKQWTWGNHEFGWAWDRELTDEGGPYVELMAGVYTDNQPDFSYLLPYESKTFSQYWWPIQKTGPVQEANQDVALRLVVNDDRRMEVALLVSSPRNQLRIVLTESEQTLIDTTVDMEPGQAWQKRNLLFQGEQASNLFLQVYDQNGNCLGQYRPAEPEPTERRREVATEPPAPQAVKTAEEQFFIGEHLEQYRHPTRDPEDYWKEALSQDEGDTRSLLALGKAALKRGEFEQGLSFLDRGIRRETRFHPNSSSGESHYYAGLCRRFLGAVESAYACFYKATWNYEWRSAAYYELACIDVSRGNLKTALEHLGSSQSTNTDHNKAVVLQACLLNRLDKRGDAIDLLQCLLEKDPLDSWARYLEFRWTGAQSNAFDQTFCNDAQTLLDIAFDFAWPGLYAEAREVLQWHLQNPVPSCAVPNPLQQSQSVLFVLAWLENQQGNITESRRWLDQALKQGPDYFFPSRLEEQRVLEWSLIEKAHWLPAFGLGNYYFDKKRHAAAISVWEEAAEGNPPCATLWRNLGIAHWNHKRDGESARQAYQKAMELDSDDARLIYEYDQLRKKLEDPVADRLAFLESHRELVKERDDASVELANLLNQSGRFEEALELLRDRRFHPWEGGEGKVLQQYSRACLGIGQDKLETGHPQKALESFQKALDTPVNLGEAYHLHQNQAEIHYWTGMALHRLDKADLAREAYETSAAGSKDFQDSAVVFYSEASYFAGLSLVELGRLEDAKRLFSGMLDHAESEIPEDFQLPYFATSLPNLLVFDEDLRHVEAALRARLKKLALHGLAVCKTKTKFFTPAKK